MINIGKFLQQTKEELSKVTWPKRKDTIELTQVVLIISIVVSLYLGGLDFIFNFLVAKFLLSVR